MGKDRLEGYYIDWSRISSVFEDDDITDDQGEAFNNMFLNWRNGADAEDIIKATTDRVIRVFFRFAVLDVENQIKSQEPRRVRNSKEYNEWRASVYKRDGYTCQNCGKTGGDLNAHHIKPFAKYPELRFDVNNGITLCKECHKLAHSKAV